MWIPARQRWPNTSPPREPLRPVFHIDAGLLFIMFTPQNKHASQLCTHQADASDTGLGHRTLAHLGGLLPEEEIQLVVISLRAVGDEVYVDESRVCGEKRWWCLGGGWLWENIWLESFINCQHFLFITCWGKHMQTPESFHLSFTFGLYWKILLHKAGWVSFRG